jgi:hypothetical protein
MRESEREGGRDGEGWRNTHRKISCSLNYKRETNGEVLSN